MRELSNVIEEMLKVIPSTEEDLITSLKDNLESVRFSAPEVMGMRWNQVYYNTICDNIFKDNKIPNKEWQYQVLSIFSTKPIEQIKKELSKN